MNAARLSYWLTNLLCVVLLGIAASCMPAHAQSMEVRNDSGDVIVIHEDKGPCVGEARAAVYIGKAGDRIPGCWVARGGVIAIVFFDTDTATIPVQAFVKSKDA